ncbi:MAG: hypothetical protein A3C35_05165 [Omnitrophica bacterium RIFCSPHIGHO2_02_FULL_46_11]|nr:MAG: hypothetical protein A3C35_05165 [Omnitrophica bacterium RIFCSPHIGHO2_02_FULL_46_11]OGW86913.1 MAG: hypothetical protein A3A81_00175 [Omnitrophica bacterium RIFCSPLOWO2_01_FULL_45_10b]
MVYTNVFDLINAELKKTKVAYLLIGGFAVNSYGVTRQTLDVDFMITADDDAKVQAVLKANGYQEVQRQDVFVRFKSPRSEWMDLDFMFVDRQTLEAMVKEGNRVQIAGHEFIVPSLMHLIALKLHSLKHNSKMREYKDMVDILRLIEINRIDVNNEDFKTLCVKYGSQELYDKIVENTGKQ